MSSSSTDPKSPPTGAGGNPRPVTTTSGARTPPRPQIPHLYPIPHHAFHVYHRTSLRPPLNPNPRINQPGPIQQGIPYPVASSGRGFVTRSLRPPDAGFAPRGIAYRPPPGPHPAQVAVDPALAHFHQLPLHGHQYAYPHRVVRHVAADPHSPIARQHPVPGAGRGAAGGGSLLKAAPSPSSVQNSNGFRSSSDGSREDKLVTISGRKVRIVEGASLYALCRSWVQNGQPQDCQVLNAMPGKFYDVLDSIFERKSTPEIKINDHLMKYRSSQYFKHYTEKPQEGDTLKPLPRPLPLAMVEDQFPTSKEGQDAKEDEDEVSVADLYPEDLLKRHIKRAKKVRARLREERQKRIARYKTRLALLLPPQVEQ